MLSVEEKGHARAGADMAWIAECPAFFPA